MTGLIAIAIVIAIVVAVYVFAGGTGLPAPPEADAAMPPAMIEPPPDSATLVERLRDLATRIEPFAQDAAHPSEIAGHTDFIAARDIFAQELTPFETVMNYALGASFALSYPALAGLALRADAERGTERVIASFAGFPPWGKHFALVYLDALKDRPPLGAPLLKAEDYWADNSYTVTAFREYFDRRAQAGERATFGDDFALPAADKLPAVRALLNALQHPLAQPLLAEITEAERTHVDYAFLNSIGKLWDHKTLASLAITPQEWRAVLDQAPEIVTRKPVRSLVVVGEAQTGKTTLLRLLAHRLIGDGWQIVEAGGAELMAGQQWFGQLEERIRRVIGEITVEKKLVWYVPDILQLARSGTHQGQSASILEQILPAISSGQVLLWTEAEPAALTRLLQMQPGLRNLLEMIRIEPMDGEATVAIAQEVGNRLGNALGVDVDPRCAAAAVEAAEHYLSHGNLPGSAIALLKLAIRSTGKDRSDGVTPADITLTLSQLTGLPASILDASEKLDLAATRAFFAARVMGQDEAVSAIVERIAMLKAGLNDPGKPVGIFLFAGPTGTGKTELAKTTASYLFSDEDRMIRLDMSEFQTPDSIPKIIGDGTPGETGSLIARVRKQPFSVILLDEFEKSWSGIWDLFLQVFDDGRLSDPSGLTADFRHCLIVMTSNLGATAHRSGGFGFAPPGDTFSNDQVMRAISQTYRPEFQNRIDRIIVFRPLDRELMRSILRKDLDDILDRRGLRDREWAVEWEASALEFLLEKGFTPEMGARPLKRAIDRYLLSPLAATIVERKFPEGEQFLFVRSDGKALQAEFVDPDAGPATAVQPVAPADSSSISLAAIALAPRGNADEFAFLASRLADIETTLNSSSIEDLKARLAGEMSADGFWDGPGRHAVLARYALIDRVNAACGTARHLLARLRNAKSKSGQGPREIHARLALQAHLLERGLEDIADDAPVEVALGVEPALDGSASDRAAARRWCEEILAMYRAWAARRNMQVEELNLPGRDLPVLLVAGFGAAKTLMAECGLHVLESEEGAHRFAARVLCAPTPLGDLVPARKRNTVASVLSGAQKSNAIVRRYRREPQPLVRNGAGNWRSPQLAQVLGGDFDFVCERGA